MGLRRRWWSIYESEGQIRMIELLLKEDKEISAYDIVTTKTVTSELFYVLNKLETDRHTENNDTTVYIYVDHDGYRGSSTFVVNAADDEDSLKQKILDAKATASTIFPTTSL